MNKLKQEQKYELSIAIPAYGYPKALKKHVTKLLEIDRDDIEIVVVDNDCTGEQIGGFAKGISDKRFHYYRNDENIGRSSNIARAVERTKAQYVLIASCDDSIRIDVINRIIEVIHKHPNCGIIMGKVVSDLGNDYGYAGEERIFRRGYDAICNIPWMGVLVPFVVNKKYLNFEKLYAQEEPYMQLRMAYTIAGRGDFVGINDVVADVLDLMTCKQDGKLEVREVVGGYDNLKKTWSVGECYYSPMQRCEQLKKDIETIEQFPLRHSHLRKLVDKWVTFSLLQCIRYIPDSHDPYVVKSSGTIGFLNDEDVLNIFEKEMTSFFSIREEENFYYYTGTLRDKIKNERIVLKQAKELMNEILREKKVAIFGTDDVKFKLAGILNCMNIEVEGDAKEKLVLVSSLYDWEIEEELLSVGAKRVRFMDWMSLYLAIVWCSENKDKELWGDYSEFL